MSLIFKVTAVAFIGVIYQHNEAQNDCNRNRKERLLRR